ncbi:MAG: lysophospholipid acyltransferase family protein [Terracidiphilus sp.]
MILRRLRRAISLCLALVLCVLGYWRARLRGPLSLEQSALWLQSSARAILAGLDIRFTVEGRPPARGLVVSNHLSYLDILILSAAMPCSFVSKIEVRRWPYFGKAARAGATIFLDRTSHASTEASAQEIARRLAFPVPILLFPEGTSTDGSRLLRFHARLFQPATQARAPITAAALRYVLENGVDERQLCWFGNAPFLPHLFKVLGVAGFTADIHFGPPQIYTDPRIAAAETHAEVSAMRGEFRRSVEEIERSTNELCGRPSF